MDQEARISVVANCFSTTFPRSFTLQSAASGAALLDYLAKVLTYCLKPVCAIRLDLHNEKKKTPIFL